MDSTGSYRTIWISDIHLGTKASEAEKLLDFIREKESDYLYLLGDIVDGETAIAEEADRLEVDGVVCGHIHKAEIRMIGDVLYCNSGDRVESCTALVEHHDGRLESISWTHPQITHDNPGFAGSSGDSHLGSSVGISWVCHLTDDE